MIIMMMNNKKENILQQLNKGSKVNYEKVASRMRLAIKIADAIESAGISKKELAAKLGKQPSEISKWLSGTHNFTHDTLFEISQVLNINLIETSGTKELCPVPIVSEDYGSIATKRILLKNKAITSRISSKDSYNQYPSGICIYIVAS